MNIEEFEKILSDYSNKIGIKLNVEQIKKFYQFMRLLVEWNEKINLTAITEPNEIILKHFIDSITINKYIEKDSCIADIGTGAGFPGIPMAIIRGDIKLVLVDSLNKRIKFLDEVIKTLELNNVETVHARAEDFGRNKNYREKFDYVTSRAVANLSTLSEYLIPLAKINGKCICMKGPSASEEVENAKKAINILGGTIFKEDRFNLPNSELERTVILVEKVKSTSNKYPRKAGMPSKEPL